MTTCQGGQGTSPIFNGTWMETMNIAALSIAAPTRIYLCSIFTTRQIVDDFHNKTNCR